MTIKEIEEKMRHIYDVYEREQRKYTSVQLKSFKKQFEIKHSVKFQPDGIEAACNLDEICTVVNVSESKEYVKKFFGGTKTVKCYKVHCSNNFSFSARLKSGADRLSVGEKIHVLGNVKAYLSGYTYGESIYVSFHSEPFKISFELY